MGGLGEKNNLERQEHGDIEQTPDRDNVAERQAFSEEFAPHSDEISKEYVERIREMKNDPRYKESNRTHITEQSIKDIRFGMSFESIDEEDDAETIKWKVVSETWERLMTYTDYDGKESQKNHWFTLNYEKLDNMRGGGRRHEMGIGLGDILLDPDIITVLIERNGEIIKGYREVIVSPARHAGRIGFEDENGEYIATRTGDRFMIVENQRSTNPEDFAQRFQEEQDARAKNKENFRENRSWRSKHEKTEAQRMLTSFTAGVREDNPDMTNAEVYGQTARMLKEMIGREGFEAESPEELRNIQMVIQDCESAQEALEKAPEFDLNVYKQAIAKIESGDKGYQARNDYPSVREKVHPDKWAFGKYQFIASNLKEMYDPNFDEHNEESIQGFLDDKQAQESIMDNFTISNLDYVLNVLKNKPELQVKLAKNDVTLYEILALIHFGGRKGARKKWQTGKIIATGQDYMGGTTKKYQEKLREFTGKKKTP